MRHSQFTVAVGIITEFLIFGMYFMVEILYNTHILWFGSFLKMVNSRYVFHAIYSSKYSILQRA